MTENVSCTVPFDAETVLNLQKDNPHLHKGLEAIVVGEQQIIHNWVHDVEVEALLVSHNIDADTFARQYAKEVFKYFVGVIGGVTQMGDCPVMATFLDYLKDRDVTSDELYIICSHFRKAMLDYLCEVDLNANKLFTDITYVFDRNFAGVLKMYSGRLYDKEMELAKNINLLGEYKNAIDESSIVSKTDEKGIITYVNDKFIDICGYSRDELIGKSHNIIRHEDTPPHFFEALWKTIRSQKIYKGTMKNRKKNGDSYYMDLTIVPIYDPVQERTEYMGIGYEVTRLVEARQDAEMAGAAKEYFLSNMSHEIRTPLNAILGFVSLLQTDQNTPKHKQYLDIIYNSGENLLSIINDILDFSKLRSGEFMVERKTFNLHDELGHTLELFAPSANEKKITMFSYIDPKIPTDLVADGLRMKQIVANLLSNAIKFTPYEGCIDILVQIEDDMLRITVQDNGMGIAKTDQDKIFNAFSQGQNYETRVSGGTGLGLSICKKLAEHMGGAIELESTLGKGSCFTLVLPVEYADIPKVQSFDTALFESVRLGLYEGDRKRPEIIALLQRYWEIFDFEVVTVDGIDDGCCDLLFFVDSDIDERIRERIVTSKVPAIAIMEHISDTYEGVASITPLYFPIYCSKLYNTMSQALGLMPPCSSEEESSNLQRRFDAHLLVAEDNAANQELMKIILERYNVTYDMVSDGIEAVDSFQRGKYDMVLMDEQMPRMNGLEAMQQILAYEKEQGQDHTPIVAITANVVKGVKERGIKAGYSAFIGKPIFLKELEAVFAHYLNEATASEVIRAAAPEEESGISGLDMVKLQKELMLEYDDIVMLLGVFLKKLETLLPELDQAISKSDFAKIAKHAHSIKGSSANFRMEEVQKLAKSIEDSASKEEAFDYRGVFETLETELSKVKVN
jgi:PAS domain S-box-containing protein